MLGTTFISHGKLQQKRKKQDMKTKYKARGLLQE